MDFLCADIPRIIYEIKVLSIYQRTELPSIFPNKYRVK